MRTEKFCASTCFWARSMALVTIPCSIGTPSSIPRLLHQAGDPIRAEDAHQVVFERQVEARRAGIALAAGAAAQLVVDAPRLVALGGEDVQPAERDDLVVLGVGLRLEVPIDAFVIRPRHAVEAVEMIEVDELFVVDELLLALGQLLGNLLRQRLLPRHELGVAAEQDVGAAAGHVGGDRHRRLAAGLRDDFRFLRVVLRVQDDVLGCRDQLQQLRQPFRLFDRHRADQHRAADFCFSMMSVTIASYFSRSVR